MNTPHHAKAQTIQEFHLDLTRLGYMRIFDPIVSQRTIPTAFDSNKIFLSPLNAVPKLTRDIAAECSNIAEVIKAPRLNIDAAVRHMGKIRTIEVAILDKTIEQAQQATFGVSHDEVNMQFAGEMAIGIFKNKWRRVKASMNQPGFIDWEDINERSSTRINGFMGAWKTMLKDQAAARSIRNQNKENIEKVNMQIGFHDSSPAVRSQAAATFVRLRDEATKRLVKFVNDKFQRTIATLNANMHEKCTDNFEKLVNDCERANDTTTNMIQTQMNR